VSGGPSDSANDEVLLDGCLRGDQSAWDALINRYAALIYSIPLKYGFGEADAADVFQSVCLTLLEKLDTIRAPRGLPAWIITTTSRQCFALARERRRERNRQAPDPSLSGDAEPLDPDPLPEEELVVLERQNALKNAIAQLPAPCRALIDGLFSDTGERLSYDQLSKQMAIAPNSLGPTRSRCLARLRRLLSAAGYT
jgi:RNA polymerase sigma factor (sigma-70 family)